MKRLQFHALLILIVLLTACSNQPTAPTATPEPTPTMSAANADVIYVRAMEAEDSTWTFHVTVRHPDTGWDDYADGWDVVLPDGTVVNPNPGSAFTRLLTHPHETEQPFTRSQGGIEIPNDVQEVTVRAHDLVDGFGGQVVVVRLDQENGLNFEVERLFDEGVSLQIGVTNQRQDGNRYVFGQIDLAQTTPVEISLDGKPLWVVGVPYLDGSVLFAAALEDGRLSGFAVRKDGAQPVDLPVSSLPPGQPPAIGFDGKKLRLLNDEASLLPPYTHPIWLDNGALASITNPGRLRILGEDIYEEIDLDALLDGRILTDGDGKLLLLTQTTTVYDHGVLGDGVEAKAFSLVGINGSVIKRVPFFTDQVIEGIAPLWADLDGDGQREIILTLSNRQDGAQLVVYAEDGGQLAQGEPIGTGYRWRHQIAVAPFGPAQELELVDVLTPHIGGVVEFFQMEGGKLLKVAEVPGYTSHVINTRNLDMALAADVDRDGQVELLLPTQSRDALGAIQRTADGAETAFEIPLNGILSSNLAGVNLPGGGLALAAGLEGGTLLVWLP